ncbi:MAG: hypothetical protein ACFCD0_05405 [Gemmataceae bacterium]
METRDAATNMAGFLSQGQIVLQQTNGFNDQSLGLLAQLVHHFGLTSRELHDAGTQLGLTEAETQQVILAAHVPEPVGIGKIIGLLLILILVLVFGGIAIWYAIQFKMNKTDTDGTETIVDDSSKDNKSKSTLNNKEESKKQKIYISPLEPSLSDEKLLSLIRDAEKNYPDQAKLFASLKVADATKRAAAWNRVLGKLEVLAQPNAISDSDPLQHVLVRSYATESVDANAMHIRHKLLELMPPKAGTEKGECGRAFWAMEVCVRILEETETPESRAKLIRQDLEKILAAELQVVNRVALGPFCGKKLAYRFLNIIEELQTREKAKARTLGVSVTPWMSKYLDRKERQIFRQRLELAFNAPSISNPMPPTGTEPTSPSTKVEPKDSEPKKIEPKESNASRVASWQALAKHVLKNEKPTTIENLLKGTIDLAVIASLGSALTQEKLPTFDNLANKPPTLTDYLSKVNKAETAIRKEPAVQKLPKNLKAYPFPEDLTEQEVVAEAFKRLQLRAKVEQRLIAIHILVVNERAKELNTQQAEYLARYYLWLKVDPLNPEFKAIQVLPMLAAKFKNLPLAFADMIDEKQTTTRVAAQKIATLILGRRITLPEKEWKEAFRKELLQTVIGERPRVLKADAAQLILRDLYRLRAELHGATIGPDLEKSSEVVKTLVDHVRVRIRSSKLNPSAKSKLEMLAARIRATDYVADNDLQRLVLMQQVWLSLLAIKVAEECPDDWNAARAIYHDCGQAMQAESLVLGQLWQGERHLVRMRALMLSRNDTTSNDE